MYRTHSQKLIYEATHKIKGYQLLYNICMVEVERLVMEEFIKVWTNPDTYLPKEYYSK